MLVCVLLMLAIWNGAMGADEICKTSSYRTCSIHMPEEIKYFPKTGEDIDQQCPYIAQYLDCLKDYAGECGYENVHHPFSEDRYQDMKSLVEDICQKDSQLHLRILQNIGCISELKNAPKECREYLHNKTYDIRKYTERKEAEGNHDLSPYNVEIWAPFLCVTESLTIACFTSEFLKRCGSDAQEVVMELVTRSGTIKDACPFVDEDRINELIRILELEVEEERILKEIIYKG